MSNTELNKIIEDKYGENGVYVHPDIYPEVEELYLLAPVAVTKEKIADFYQKYDYQGVRNALDIARNLQQFTHDLVYDTKVFELTPSQKAYVALCGINVDFFVKAGKIQ